MRKSSGSFTGEGPVIMEQLKANTQKYHSELETLPYFQALIEQSLPLEKYVNQLRALSVLHGVFEQEIATVENEDVNAIWQDDLAKLPLIEQDLSFFAPRIMPGESDAINIAMRMVGKIRLLKLESPFSLLGYLYVFEGSTLGNKIHLPDIIETFNLNGEQGCSYYASYRERVEMKWSEFSSRMNQVLASDEKRTMVVEAAIEAFEGLKELYVALNEMDQDQPRSHATRINPEAGNHPIPEDEREIEAALKASEKVWEEFGYYEKRFGARGRKFSDSDTCWLVTLATLEQHNIDQQIEWLCRVLATRGMPSIMLERTLLVLAAELSDRVPEKSEEYNKLAVAGNTLADARAKIISTSTMLSIAEEFDRARGAEQARAMQNTGMLIVCAVVDDKLIAEGSLEALVSYLTSAEFPQEWCEAVLETVKKAHSIMTG